MDKTARIPTPDTHFKDKKREAKASHFFYKRIELITAICLVNDILNEIVSIICLD